MERLRSFGMLIVNPWEREDRRRNGIAPAFKASESSSNGASKEHLGQSTWTFLHTLAAQYPENPTRSQKKDTTQLISCMSRMYPCAECAKHFQQHVRREPPQVESKDDLEQWMCKLHNNVNDRLGKPTFNCNFVRSRWQELDCDTAHACSLTGR